MTRTDIPRHPDDTAHLTWAMARCAELRKHAGILQHQLARTLGCKHTNVSQLEARGADPKLPPLARRAAAIGHPMVVTAHRLGPPVTGPEPWPALRDIINNQFGMGFSRLLVAERIGVTENAIRDTMISGLPHVWTLQRLVRAMDGILEIAYTNDPFQPWEITLPDKPVVKYPEGPKRCSRRVRLGITDTALAAQLGWTSKSLNYFESGRVWPLPAVADLWDQALTAHEKATGAETTEA